MRTVTDLDLEEAFAYAIPKTRAGGRVHVEDSLVNWRENLGSRTNRIRQMYFVQTHHTGSEIGVDRLRSYVTSLATGSIRPEIGACLCNTSTIRAGQWPGSNGKPTIVILNDNYANHSGMGDQRILDELADGDIDTLSKFRPSGDDLYLNRFGWGDEGVGSHTDAGQQLAFVEFYGHALAFLGMHLDTDNDGRRSVAIAHFESTTRKIDPVGADMPTIRAQMEAFWDREYGVELPGSIPVTDPLVVKQPLPVDGEHIVVDGVFSRKTIARLQTVIGAKSDGIWGPESKRKLQEWLGVTVDGEIGRVTIKALQTRVGAPVDGVWGPKTTTYLQRFLNSVTADLARAAKPLTLVVDGVLGTRTIAEMQRWVGTTPDGVWGPNTTRALQAKVGARVDGVKGPETARKLQAMVGASPDGVWGAATTRALQAYLNRL